MSTVQGQIQGVRKAVEEYHEFIKQGRIMAANQTLVNSWSTIEWCLQKIAKSKDVEVDGDAQDDGSHSFHENLITAFAKPPLSKDFPPLSSGPAQAILWDSKVIRNMWSKPGRFSDQELTAEMHKMVNGIPIIINALEEARKKAGLN